TACEPFSYIFEFLYKTGLRIGELENLTENDITQEGDNYIIKVKGKGNKERILRVSKHVIDLLYKAGFPNLPHRRQIQKEAQRISKLIGKRITPHIFRHSFAIRLLAEGKPITLVKNILGHSKLDTTAIYTNISSADIILT
ncbi:tyrosine-type recombinase/integrase, partial [Candidatus Sumerlaeota bacterium]|nr:tyrosine-type recombinase/integrase [Candidatus Sumerlaeota bacterium]